MHREKAWLLLILMLPAAFMKVQSSNHRDGINQHKFQLKHLSASDRPHNLNLIGVTHKTLHGSQRKFDAVATI
jgi:hypothetical protein